MRNFFESSEKRVDMEKAHERAEEVLSERVQESDFSDVYPEEEILSDRDRVAQLKLKHDRDRTPAEAELKKNAEILEAIVFERGELDQWFSESGFTIGASEYDDYVNGIDLVVEFREPDSRDDAYLALGIDVTFTSDTTAKFDKLRAKIENGKLGEMKYFASEHSSTRGGIRNLPEVVVGVDMQTLEELQGLWMENNNSTLESHRVQIMMLKQIDAQLDTFAQDARAMDKLPLAEIFESRLKIVRKLLAEKFELSLKVVSELERDSVHRSIMDYMHRWQKVIKQSSEKVSPESQDIERPLTVKESLSVQRELILDSELDAMEWIAKYAEHFGDEIIQDPAIRRMIRINRDMAITEISARLYRRGLEQVA